MAEHRYVCKICFNSSSHKPNPILTPETKTTPDPSEPGKPKCTVCGLGWAPVRVAKETIGPTTFRWVRIRQPPKIPPGVDFQLCKNTKGRADCSRGQDCSYAHSKVELNAWREEREDVPRRAPPVPVPLSSYQLCRHVQNTGQCPFGKRCSFAHSPAELNLWLRNAHSNPGASQSVQAPAAHGGGGGRGGGWHYQAGRQLPPSHSHGNHGSFHGRGGGGGVRKRPFISPTNGFRMCMHVLANRTCVYGEFCTFAHSEGELEVWNRRKERVFRSFPKQVNTPTQPMQSAGQELGRYQGVPFTAKSVASNDASLLAPNVMEQQKSSVFAVSSDLDDFEEGSEEGMESADFADQLRARVVEEYSSSQDTGGSETSLNGVCVEEISGQPLSLTWTQPGSVQWTFAVSTANTSNTTNILQSVILLDALTADYSIIGAWMVFLGGQQKLIEGVTPSVKGSGLLLKSRLPAGEKVYIKVSLKPRSGILGQIIIFDFGSFILLRNLNVHVLNEKEKATLMEIGVVTKQKREKPDLYWEQHYTTIAMPGYELDEEFDSTLPDYPLPQQIEKLIEDGKYNNVENKVTKENYKRRMHNLLYLEEYQQRVDMSRYDLYDIKISPENHFSTPNFTSYAEPGFHYITVSLEEVLYEGARSIRPNDSALLLPKNQDVVHECSVETVAREKVTLKITSKVEQAAKVSKNMCSVRFVLSRTHMKEMHYAVDNLDLSVVFPDNVSSDYTGASIPSSLSHYFSQPKNSHLYSSQRRAITSMLDPACQKIPSLVLGPFGCGKTRTLRDCIFFLSEMEGDTHILVCTHSNSAANIYVRDLHEEYQKRYNKNAPILRIFYTKRNPATIPPIVRFYSKIQDGRLAVPSLSELKQFKIVVVTLSTARALSLLGLPKGHFTHIFIDEAAQALESEALIPLIVAGERTKIVLAGDHMQMDPPCYSEIARKYNLHVSLLERLYDNAAYKSGVGLLCKILLTENHRSHRHILAVPSKLFYKNKLIPRAEFPPTGPKNIPTLKFIGVEGQEMQDEDSPSYYNDIEGLKVVEQAKLLVSGGLKEDEVCVLAYYHKQVTRIRFFLRKEHLNQINVTRVEDAQGQEYRALILSTVRTCSGNDGNLQEDAGFLNNPKLFNTAVTRAKEWLIVCGEPITLCTVGSNRVCWLELIKKAHSDLDSFEYPNASEFEQSLEVKRIARQIIEKKSGPFQERNIISAASESPVSPVVMTTEESVSVATAAAQAPSSPPYDSNTTLTDGHTLDLDCTSSIAPYTSPVLSSTAPPVVSQPNSSMPPSQGGQISAGSKVPENPVETIAPDLPLFLRKIIDGLTSYMQWCDFHLKNPQTNHPTFKENISKQHSNLQQQIELVNSQIHLYRELIKIIHTTPSSVTPAPSMSNIPSGPPRGTVAMGGHNLPPYRVPVHHQQGGPVHPGGLPQFLPPQILHGMPPTAVHHQQIQQQHIQQQMIHQQQFQQQHQIAQFQRQQQQQMYQQQQIHQQQQMHHQQQHYHLQHLQQQMYQGRAPPTQGLLPSPNSVAMTPGVTPGGNNFGVPSTNPFHPSQPLTSNPSLSFASSTIHSHPTPGHAPSTTGTTDHVSQPSQRQGGLNSAQTHSTLGFSASSYFPKAQPDEPLTQLSVKTNIDSKASTKGLSPLAAAVKDASVCSSPSLHNDVYLSDDEFNS